MALCFNNFCPQINIDDVKQSITIDLFILNKYNIIVMETLKKNKKKKHFMVKWISSPACPARMSYSGVYMLYHYITNL